MSHAHDSATTLPSKPNTHQLNVLKCKGLLLVFHSQIWEGVIITDLAALEAGRVRDASQHPFQLLLDDACRGPCTCWLLKMSNTGLIMCVRVQRNGGKRQGEKGKWPHKAIEALKSQLGQVKCPMRRIQGCPECVCTGGVGLGDLHLRNQSS